MADVGPRPVSFPASRRAELTLLCVGRRLLIVGELLSSAVRHSGVVGIVYHGRNIIDVIYVVCGLPNCVAVRCSSSRFEFRVKLQTVTAAWVQISAKRYSLWYI